MATAAKKIEDSAPLEREVSKIPSNNLNWQSEGFQWREAMVRLPSGAVLQDLNDSPEMWSVVQSNAIKALRKWDRVRIVSFAEDWFADATVSHADLTQVILAGVKKTAMPARAIENYEDAMYRVEWAGSGFAVLRKSDGANMGSQTFQTVGAAKSFLFSLYPRKAS